MYIATRAPDSGKWGRLFAKRRNWLLIWRMAEKEITAKELAEKSGCTQPTILRLMSRPGSVPNAEAMKKICQALQSQPHELGWCRRTWQANTPYRMDIGPFYECVDNLMKFHLHVHHEFALIRKKLNMIYMDYCDRMSVEDPSDAANVVQPNLADPFLETGEKIKEIVGDDPSVEDW